MKKKRNGLKYNKGLILKRIFGIIFISLMFFPFLTVTTAFCCDPIFTDDEADAELNEDILKIWIENNNTYLLFKIELKGFFNESSKNTIRTLINVDNATGSDNGGIWNIKADFEIYLTSDDDFSMNITDLNNGSNNLDDTHEKGLSFWKLSSDNKSVEFGYKLQTRSSGAGFLNVSLNQLINLQFYAMVIIGTDYAPDMDEGFITYILIEETIQNPDNSDWIITWLFWIFFIFIIIGGLGLFSLLRKRESKKSNASMSRRKITKPKRRKI